jgi:beta-glucosidase
VLLKNDGNLLPLVPAKVKTIAVFGPNAYPAQPVGGGSAGVRPFRATSVLEGIADDVGERATVTYAPGLPALSELADHTDFVTDASTAGKRGLTIERFVSDDLTGTPAEVGTEDHVNFGFEWPSYFGIPSKFRSVRWTGYYVAKTGGAYEAFIQGPGEDGAYRLFIDDRLVIDSWSSAVALVNQAVLDLAPGPHKVRLELRRTFGDPNVRLGIFSGASVVAPEVARLAAKADAAVIVVGFDPSSESEGADRSFRLPPGQDALIRAVLAANKNAIVVITSGGAVDMTGWIDRVPALLQAWYPGQEGGTALAQVLFGEVNPSGKLPVSFERRLDDNPAFKNYYPEPGAKRRVSYAEGVFVGYRHYDRSGTKPLFPFGFGLSYTTFGYSNLSVTPGTGDLAAPVKIAFDVTNTGSREGAEVCQVYIGDGHASAPRPVKELKGFTKVSLKPGETRHVVQTLDRRAFSYYDPQRRGWRAQPGAFAILVGGSSSSTPLQGVFTLR